MIKILFIIDSLSGGGAEKVLRTLVNNMDQSRFEITVTTLWPEDADKFLVPGITHRSVYKRKNRIIQLWHRVEAELGLTYALHMKDDYDIEVAYLECAPTKIIAASTNKKALKLAWVHCDLKQKADDPAAFAKKCAPWYRKFDKVVCVSENVKQSYVELFGDVPAAVVVRNAVDDRDILDKARQPLPVPKKRFTIVTAGRLCEQKGYDRLLNAHKRLTGEGYSYDLWILGEGPDRNGLEALVQQNGLTDSVKLLGFCDNPYPYFQAADLLVCSSRYEGLSTFVSEGLILGKPIVTTDCTGMGELLGDSEYGLITENSEQGIYEGLKKLLNEPELLEKYQVLAAACGQSFKKNVLVQQTEGFFANQLIE